MRSPSPRRAPPLPTAFFAALGLNAGCAEVHVHVGETDARSADCTSDRACTLAATLRGSVVDADDDTPIHKARVVALDAEGLEIAGPEETDPDGAFELEVEIVGSGTVWLGASAPSYHTVPSDGHPANSVTLDDDVPITIDDERTLIDLERKGNGNGND